MAINLPLSDMKIECGASSFDGRVLCPTSQEDISGIHAWRLRSGSICSFSRQRTNSPHMHRDCYEICLVLSGSGDYFHGDARHSLSAGDVFLAEPGATHEISSLKTADLLLAFFIFSTDAANSELDDLLRSEAARNTDAIIESFLGGHSIIAGGCNDLAGYIHLLAREELRPSTGAMFGTELLWRGFAFECLNRLASVKALPGGQRKRETHPLDKTIEFLHANVSRQIGVEALAKVAGVSSRQLRRLFKVELGCEPRDMIANAKIQRSLHLLSMRFSVNETARAIGESSQAQFCRLFKRRMGVTPKEYQRMHAPKKSKGTSP